MPTVNYGIATTADDATTIPSVTNSSTGVAFGSLSGFAIYGALRFLGVAPSPSDNVTAATITLTRHDGGPALGQSPGSSGVTSALLRGVNVANQGALPADLTTLATTSASATITNGATVTVDVLNIVKAIQALSGWASGNAMAFVGDPTGATGFLEAYDYSSDPAKSAVLSITYDTGGPATYAIDAVASGSGTAVGAASAVRPVSGASQASGMATGRFVPPPRTIKAYRFFPRFAGDSDAWYGGASVVTGPEFWDATSGGVSYTIDGAANGVGLSVGAATRTVPAAAVSAGIGISTGAVGRQAPAASGATGSGTALGDMGVQGGVTGTATGTGTAAGNAGVQRPAAGDAASSGTSSGAVLRLATINGVAVGWGTATGDAGRTAPIVGNATGAGVSAGDVGTSAPADPSGMNALVNRRRRRSSVR